MPGTERAEVEIAVLKTEIKHLTEQMGRLTDRLEEVIEIMNRSRGALWAAMLIASAGTACAGGIIGFVYWLLTYIKH